MTVRRRGALAAGALLAASAAATVGVAPAAGAVSTSVVSAGVVGPSSTFSEVVATADCRGRQLAGGGTRLGQTTLVVEHNGIHIDGSTPSADGVADAPDGVAGPTRWLAAGGAGGGVPDDALTVAYGICLDTQLPPTAVVATSTRGPSGTYEMVRTTATCPAGTRLLSGGARTTPGTVGSLKPNGSFPSDALGTPALGGANPSSWTATGLNGGGGDKGNATHAFALCLPESAGLTVTVAHAQVPGPARASSAAQTTASCPAGTALLGGGAYISDRFGLPGSQGDHLTGSYPSDAAGTPVATGVARAWTAASHTGGVDSGPLTQTDAWALCASAADAPPPTDPVTPTDSPRPSPGARPPAGTLPGIARAVAVDGAGNTYLTGETDAADFPTRRALRPRRTGHGTDAFVVKRDRAGRVVWATLLGGSRNDTGHGIAVDRSGAVYVAGRTSSTDFPTTRGAVQRSHGGGPFDAFVTKIAPDGRRLAYSTLLGDTHYDEAHAIAVDARGGAVLTGRTASPQFPVARPAGRSAARGAFVTVLDPTGSRVVSSTVLGGRDPANHGNTGFGVAVDRRGAVYVTGVTNARDFPAVRAVQRRLRGPADAFVVKLDPARRRIVYATLLGGSGDEIGRAIAVDAAGGAYVAGVTTSRDLPLRRALQRRKASRTAVGADAFATRLDPSGRLRFSTYLGGARDDGAAAIAAGGGRVHVAGQTASPDFPGARGRDGRRSGFVVALGGRGRPLLRSTRLGNGADDAATAIAVGADGTVHVAGQTRRSGGAGGVLVRSLPPLRSGG